ncbi:hypothetical protein KGY73_03390 [bacterium]|nr:hypothetical protein [bacterium]
MFKVKCPLCHSFLWIDSQNKEVIHYEKAEKKKGSLEDLLSQEKQRKKEFGRRFEATAELSEERRKEAHKKFKKYLKERDNEE